MCVFQESAPAAAADEDDDLDLFGDETEEEKKAAEEREQAKASTKKKESEFLGLFLTLCFVFCNEYHTFFLPCGCLLYTSL